MNSQLFDQLYRKATDACAGISFTDGNAVITHANDHFCDMTGFSAHELVGKRHTEILLSLNESITEDLLTKHFYHHQQWRGELRILNKAGQEVWTDTTILPVFDNEGGLTGIFSMSLDITEKKRIEVELGFNQQKLGFVLESLKTAFWEWDIRTQTAWFNDNWPRMLGLEPHEIPRDAQAWSNYIHPDDHDRILDEVRFHIKENTSAFVCLQRFRHKSGKWIHVMTKGRVAERDHNNNAIRFIGVNNDISAMNQLEDFSLHIQDMAELGTWDIDIQSGDTHWSRKIYEIFELDPQLKPEELNDSMKLFSSAHHNKIRSAYTRLLEYGTPYDIEAQLHNGKWVRLAGKVDLFEGKPYRAFGIVQDINDRKIAEEGLRTSQETLQVALKAGEFGVWDWNIIQNSAYWSPTMRTLFNQQSSKSHYTFEEFLEHIHPEDQESLKERSLKATLTENTFDSTFRIKKNNQWIWIRSISNIYRDEQNRPTRMIGINWDITAQMETIKAQALAVEEASKASRMKSQFMATVSHEIRTPMSGVIGMTELLSETELTAEQREIVQTIKTCGENLLNLVNDILDYSRLEADKVALDKRPFKLKETIKNTLDLFQYKARQKNIQLHSRIAQDVPEIIFQDEARLYQVLFNLVGNAIKFTNNGSIIVEVKANQSKLMFQVSDSGIGIPEDKLDMIFESFSQVSPGHQAETTGTGLGLAISKSLVHLMDGDLKVTSSLGQGSSFYFEIDAPKAQISPELDIKVSQNTIGDYSALKILVVEDNPINQKLLVSILERHKVKTDVAEDGLIAIEKIKKKNYDLIFMDVQMPVLDGLETTKRIRAEIPTKDQPIIIALTANVSPEHQKECLLAGMNDFLPKPIRVQTIRSLLQFYSSTISQRTGASKTIANIDNIKSATILNRERLFREFSGFEDLLLQFTQIFLDNYTSYLQQIETELANHQIVSVSKSIHTFKGIVGNFQSAIVIKNLELLEDLARSGNIAATKDCFHDTTALISSLVLEIQALRDSLLQQK